jgi:hypothetical protein
MSRRVLVALVAAGVAVCALGALVAVEVYQAHQAAQRDAQEEWDALAYPTEDPMSGPINELPDWFDAYVKGVRTYLWQDPPTGMVDRPFPWD